VTASENGALRRAIHVVRFPLRLKLFEATPAAQVTKTTFDVSPDGKRFVMVKSDRATALRTLTLALNWFAASR